MSGIKKTYLDLYHVRVTSNSFMKRKKRDAELKDENIALICVDLKAVFH